MNRADLSYNVRRAVHPVGGSRSVDASTPVAGFYRFRFGAGTVKGAVRIWYGPPHDPVTGEELDRSHRWQATFYDEPIDFDRVWPVCASEPISETEFKALVARRDWARQHAPESAYAKAGRKHDPLSSNAPLPF